MGTPIEKRILSAILAAITLLSLVVVPGGIAVETTAEDPNKGETAPNTADRELVYDYDTLKIMLDGVQTHSLDLLEYEKITVTAQGIQENARYQWQILHPEQVDTWVNIYDATEAELAVTAALVKNMLDDEGRTKLRCRAYTDSTAYLTAELTVTLVRTLPGIQNTVPTANSAMDEPEAPTEAPEFVTITVNYLRYDYVKNSAGQMELSTNGVQAFTSYIATIQYGGDLSAEVKFPTIVGYESYLAEDSTGALTGLPKAATSLTIDKTNVKENIEYVVHYKPASVKYVVHYFFQNVYDDNYVEDATKTVIASGETGSAPKTEHVNAVFDGFTSMYYQPDTIAADGSTVFEVYYERNYYLMDFDCAGGYGADPVYVRYGTYISVPNPVRSGWTFAGWDLTGAKNEDGDTLSLKEDNDGNLIPYTDTNDDGITPIPYNDGIRNDLLATMPYYNAAYKAIWVQNMTTYTVAYWLQDGDKKTFLGSRSKDALTGAKVSGLDDYSELKECGIYEEHFHIDDCYTCTKPEHIHHEKHIDSCFNYVTTWGSAVTVTSNDKDWYVMQNADQNGGKPETGYIYFIYTTGNASRWPKMYIDGEYRTIYLDGKSNMSAAETLAYVDESTKVTGTYGTYCVERYKAKTTCGLDCSDCTIEEHTHDDSCISCGKVAHTHNDSCDAELHKYVIFDSENTETGITVEGDASTVVNVYYTYKTYTIRYVYAKATKGTSGSYDTFYASTSTIKGTLESVVWTQIGTDESSLPEFPDPEGKTGLLTFENDTKDVKYYYISLKAHYGENIVSKWPAHTRANITFSGNTFTWGSWAAEVGTQYKTDHSDNANVVGSYPTLSAEMITADPELLEDGTYLAQNMIGWWANSVSGNNYIGAHSYHNYFEVLSAPEYDGTISDDPRNPTKIDNDYYVRFKKNGADTYKIYKLQNDSFYANHDGWTRVDPFEFIGFDWIDTGENLSNSNTFYYPNCEVCGDACEYCNVFYYDRTPRKLFFWNLNQNLQGGDGSTVLYGTPLKNHGAYLAANMNMNRDYYPSELEPNAYFFDGWYTSAECLDDTEMDWENTTMPDSDFTVYAKWSPVIHDVYFYYDYEDFSANPKVPWSETNKDGAPIQVTHGELLGTTHYVNPTKQGYNFIGWFYLDDNGKKRFAPESMEIKRPLHLFAEWISATGEATTYEVSYVYVDSNGNVVEEIAGRTAGYSTAGKTKTFSAKGVKELYSEYQKGYFPETASHSILMGELDANGETPNTYQFRYVYDEQVWYKIRYVDVATNKELTDNPTVASTSDAVITVRHLPIGGYVPMPGYYYQTKALSADYETGSATNVLDANVITFYYMEDKDHGAYSIEYYVEDENGGESYDGKNYRLKTSIANTADINENLIAQRLEFDGFKFSAATVINFDANGSPKTPVVIKGNDEISGTVDAYGLTIKLYYTKLNYEYTIKFVEWGSKPENILGYGTVDNDSVLNEDPNASASFGTEIVYTAPASFEIGGIQYNYYLERPKDSTDQEWSNLRTQTLNIRTPVDDNPVTDVDETYKNELVFYFTQRQVTVLYKAVCTVPDITSFGFVSYYSETAATADTLTGSTATAGFGFRFVGWYSDESFNDDKRVSTEPAFKPSSLDTNQDTVTYYALFAPVLTQMTIQNVCADGEDSFLIHVEGIGKTSYVDMIVTISGNGQVTVSEVPVGSYTVTLVTGWSWMNNCTNANVEGYHTDALDPSKYPVIENETSVFFTTTDQSTGNNVTFTNSYSGSDWLNGESRIENDFTQA